MPIASAHLLSVYQQKLERRSAAHVVQPGWTQVRLRGDGLLLLMLHFSSETTASSDLS